jgi:hypothetical protein
MVFLDRFAYRLRNLHLNSPQRRASTMLQAARKRETGAASGGGPPVASVIVLPWNVNNERWLDGKARYEIVMRSIYDEIVKLHTGCFGVDGKPARW